MTIEDTQFTVGKTAFYQGENGTHPLFRIEPGIPCRDAREQSSELMGYVRELTITGLMDEKPMMIWAAHYLSAMAKALKLLRRTHGAPTTNPKPTTWHPAPPTVAPPTNPHESSRIWSKFVLYSAPAISLHTRTGH